jgi:hypothetical protein
VGVPNSTSRSQSKKIIWSYFYYCAVIPRVSFSHNQYFFYFKNFIGAGGNGTHKIILIKGGVLFCPIFFCLKVQNLTKESIICERPCFAMVLLLKLELRQKLPFSITKRISFSQF